ncbi:hypothetical protein HY029_04410 [Candidatus Gottesmanbacteria bacterium]|nr:hypothetical protein [Candidatus Gottesmanbacteria bacterium]
MMTSEEPKPRVDLNSNQILDKEFGWTTLNRPLISGFAKACCDLPLFSKQEGEKFCQGIDKFLKNDKNHYWFNLAKGKEGLLNLFDTLSRNHNTPVGEGAKKILDSTEITIIDSFEKAKSLPIELQIVLGLGGEKLINDVHQIMKRDGYLVFLKETRLPPDMLNALHRVVDYYKGDTNRAIREIYHEQNGQPEVLVKEQDDETIKEDINLIRAGSGHLIKCRIISSEANEQTTTLNNELSSLIDKHLVKYYAIWQHTLEAVKGDVQMATVALGISAGVALILSQAGLENSGNALLEAVKRVIPIVIADLATNASAAWVDVKEGQPRSEKLKELGSILMRKYKKAISTGLVSSAVGGSIAVKFQEAGMDLAAAAMLGLSILVPTIFTTRTGEQSYLAGENATHDKKEAKEAMKSHPVRGSLMHASDLSAVLLNVLALVGQFNNPILYTAVTEGVEPSAAAGFSISKLIATFGDYKQMISKNTIENPQQNFMRVVPTLV